jgi:hypothetical protein
MDRKNLGPSRALGGFILVRHIFSEKEKPRRKCLKSGVGTDIETLYMDSNGYARGGTGYTVVGIGPGLGWKHSPMTRLPH